MLTTHRNQENLVPAHQVNSKMQPKTPGARFPKTPLKYGHNDENSATVFAGKSVLKDTKTSRQALVTPSDARARAPLGNKTTNAKARTDQQIGGKETVNKAEKSQAKPTTTQKPRLKQITPFSTRLTVKSDEADGSEEEPEFAPRNPKPLPYESDVLPKGGLTVHGLGKDVFLKGYYEHFYNPVDENGISRRDKQFADEMKSVVEEADKVNQKELDALDWGVAEETKPVKPPTKRPASSNAFKPSSGLGSVRAIQRNPPTIVSRRAASALAMPAERERQVAIRSAPAPVLAKKPLSSLLRGSKPKPASSLTKPAPSGTMGNAVSRTTLGYNKGRTASSMVHPTKPQQAAGTVPARRAESAAEDYSDLTITPARMKRASPTASKAQEDGPVPSFMSLFEDESDEEELTCIKIPHELLIDDDEEEFEFK